jgi:hypothetical protein
MTADHLFRLIKTLSKNEKGYIKKNASLHTINGQKNKYIKLFDALDRMKVYEEKTLHQSFLKDPFLKSLPVAKNYLFHFILRQLEAYHKSTKAEIRSALNQAEILYEKGLIDQCRKKVEKAEIQAKKYELTEELFAIYSWKLNLPESGKKESDNEKDIQSIRKEMELQTEQLRQTLEDESELRLITNRCHFLGIAREQKDILPLENTLAILEKKKPTSNSSFAIRYLHYQKLTTLYQALHKPMKELIYCKKKIELFRENMHMLDVQPNLYLFLTELERSFHLEFMLGYYDSMLDSFESLFRQCQENPVYKKLMQTYLLTLKFGMNVQLGKFELALKQVSKINAHFTDIDFSETLEIRKKRFILDSAVALLAVKNYGASLRQIDELLKASSTEINSDIYYFAQVLQLIVYFEKGDIELLLYRTRSAYRTLYRHNKLHRIEKLLLDFLRKENEAGWDKKAQTEIFTRLEANLEVLFKQHPEEKKLLSYFDLTAWVESKIDKVAIQEVLQLRFRRVYDSVPGKQLLKYLSEPN